MLNLLNATEAPQNTVVASRSVTTGLPTSDLSTSTVATSAVATSTVATATVSTCAGSMADFAGFAGHTYAPAAGEAMFVWNRPTIVNPCVLTGGRINKHTWRPKERSR